VDPRHHDIAIAGSGPMAQALGRLLQDRGVTIVAVGSRSATHAARAAAFIGRGVRPVPYRQLPALASNLLIAVTDRAIRDVAEVLAETDGTGKVAVHTCGAHGPEVLDVMRTQGFDCGVMHPLQTVPTPEQGLVGLPGAPFGISGDSRAVEWAEAMIAALDGISLRVAADRFAMYHAGAVLAGNGAFALVDTAVRLLHEAGIEPARALEALAPLCRRSMDNALTLGGPALTGPVARGDVDTVKAHLAALTGDRHAAALYTATSLALVDVAKTKGTREQALVEIEDALTS
jgi:predicted short-subunit dehydrogenase-like oxidoreductase (DUF2520 family)